MDLFSLKGKKAIVTGGTRGLGYGMAEGLCRAGAEVTILGTSEKVRESADALARTTGVVVHGIVGDLVREEEVPKKEVIDATLIILPYPRCSISRAAS